MAAEYDLATVNGRARLLKAPRSTPYYARRTKGLYLGLRVTANSATWCARYQAKNGKPQFITFKPLEEMTHDQAARMADTWGDSLQHGRPIARGDRTIAHIVHFYLEEKLAKKPKRKSDGACASFLPEHLMRIHLLGQASTISQVKYRGVSAPVFRKSESFPVHPLAFRVASEVIESEFEHWRAGLKSAKGKPLSQGSTDRICSILGAALNFAVKKRLLPASCGIEWKEALKQVGGGKRERALDRAEIKKLLAGCQTQAFRDLCEVGVLTGARYSEIAGARVKDWNDKRGLLTVDGKTGPRTFPVTDEAAVVIRRLCKGKTPLAWLCPNNYGEQWRPSQQTGGMNRMRANTGFGHDVSFYTLRHTFISHALTCDNPLPPLTVAEICGTSLQMINDHYGHLIEENHAPVRAIRIR